MCSLVISDYYYNMHIALKQPNATILNNIHSTLPSKYRYAYNTVKQYSYSNEVPSLHDYLRIMS